MCFPVHGLLSSLGKGMDILRYKILSKPRDKLKKENQLLNQE